MTTAKIDHANIAEITRVLLAAGVTFYGLRLLDTATEWDGFGFSAATVERWTSIGVWMPSVADQLDAVGLKPRQALRAAKTLDGDAIYDACNGDRPVGDIIRAYRGE